VAVMLYDESERVRRIIGQQEWTESKCTESG